jgi:hypothetical protein
MDITSIVDDHSVIIRDLAERMDSRYIVCRGGRSGKKIHLAAKGSTVLNCGKWLKTSVTHFEISKTYRAPLGQLCEKCFDMLSVMGRPIHG